MNMTVFPLLAVSFTMKVVAAFWFICALALILIVLIQKGKGGGLSGVLAGGTVGGLLGSKSKEPLTWITIVLVGVFLTLAVVMAKSYRPAVSDFGERPAVQRLPVQQELPAGLKQPSPIDDIGAMTSGESTDVNSLGD